MPVQEATRTVPSLKMLTSQQISLARARAVDYDFLQKVIREKDVPENNGFNTRASREQGQSIHPATKAIYTPLIDMVPSEPDTIMTAMNEAQKLTLSTGQAFTLFTNDQQLYRVAVHVLWVYPEKFPNFIPRLGGMHTLMSFIGAVGTLMCNSGLEEILQSAFGGVPKMLSGKRFPQNVRALRMVVEELLRETLSNDEGQDDPMERLDTQAALSTTTKLWVDNLIKPVLIMMIFVWAEREGDWPLHMWAVQQMIPYFFASGHTNYARYGLYYLRSMERLPDDILEDFSGTTSHASLLWAMEWNMVRHVHQNYLYAV